MTTSGFPSSFRFADRERDEHRGGSVVPFGLETAVAAVQEHRHGARTTVCDCEVRPAVTVQVADRHRARIVAGAVVDRRAEPSIARVEENRNLVRPPMVRNCHVRPPVTVEVANRRGEWDAAGSIVALVGEAVAAVREHRDAATILVRGHEVWLAVAVQISEPDPTRRASRRDGPRENDERHGGGSQRRNSERECGGGARQQNGTATRADWAISTYKCSRHLSPSDRPTPLAPVSSRGFLATGTPISHLDRLRDVRTVAAHLVFTLLAP